MMKYSYATLATLFAVCLLVGCTSLDSAKFGHQVQQWVPMGTTAAEAQSTMEKHGFDCTLVATNTPFNHTDHEFIDCEKNAGFFHTWNAQILLKEGKVSGYGDTTIE